jgi:glycosyltransferase involved in cell wall biosynthesis
MKLKIGCGMICKNESQDIPRALDAMDQFADLIVIVDTGSTDDTIFKVGEFCQANGWTLDSPGKDSYPAKTLILTSYLGASEKDEHGDWKLWDFSKARNQFVDILEPLVEWMSWMDADDVLLEPEKVRPLVEGTTDEKVVFGFRIVNDAENPTHTWTHHRLWRTGLGVRFHGACHEAPTNFDGCALIASGLDIYHKCEFRLGQEIGDSRNLRILEREYNAGRVYPRLLFYYANTLKDTLQFEKAIKVYDEYLASGSSFRDEVVFAHIFKARCLRYLKRPLQAVGAAFIGLNVDSRFSELWMEAAYGYSAIGDRRKATAMCLAALQPIVETQMFQEKDKYTTEPARVLSLL